MDLQQPIDYLKMFSELMQRRIELTKQRDETEIEIAKLRQLILAIFPLLPEDKQKPYQETIEGIEAENAGLQDAIKLVFSAHKGEWLTPANVRDYLAEMGFDFRQYQTNPLASIGTTLRRMAPGYLESKTSADGALYQRRLTLLDQMARNVINGPDRSTNELPDDHPLSKAFGRPATPLVGVHKTGVPKYGQPDPLNRRKK